MLDVELPPTNHNNPPDPIDEWLAPYSDTISEAENWLDGEPVETEDQMKAIDALIKTLRTANTDLGKAKKSATAPLHDAWKAEVARWEPTEDDLKRVRDGLVALVAPIKAKIAAEKEAAQREAQRLAREAEEDARRKAMAADATDIEAQREAAQAQADMEAAHAKAKAASKDTVGGLRTVQRFEVTDKSALLHWINANDRPALDQFAVDYARRTHTAQSMDGVRVWTEKEAY